MVEDGARGSLLRLAAVLAGMLLLCASAAVAANQLTVSPRKVTVDDTLEITLVLEGSFAGIDEVRIPVRNLRIDGTPSVSTQFQWINGKSSRRKVRTYGATPTAVGVAVVGPLVLRDGEGRQIVLPAVTIDVLSSAATGGSPEAVAGQLEQTGKEELFILAETEKTSVYAGEQVVVTWYLYTAVPARDFGISKAPSSPDFWVEELTVNGIQPQTVLVNGRHFKRFAVRRAALFPLRSGTLVVGSLEGIAEVVEPIIDVFGQSVFEGRLESVRRKSQALSIEARPLPAGGSVDAVGEYDMTCSTPNVPKSGPVALNVTITGRGNLRAAAAPRFAAPIDADVDVQEAGLKVIRAANVAVMTRTWRILIFPRRTGALVVPPIVFDEFDPAKGTRQRLTCGGEQLRVAALQRARENRGTSAPAKSPSSSVIPYVAGGAAVVLLALAGVMIVRNRRTYDRRAFDRLIAPPQAREKRRALFEVVSERGIDPSDLMNERTELGDRFRAVVSWIDTAQRETLTGDASPAEYRRRAKEFLVELSRR